MKTPAKLCGPVATSVTDSGSVLLRCDRGLMKSLMLVMLVVLFPCLVWIPLVRRGALLALSLAVIALAALWSAIILDHPEIIVSTAKKRVERLRRSAFMLRWRNELEIPFSDIKEFLVQAEMQLGPGHPVAYHLLAVKRSGEEVHLSWHIRREPILEAAQEVSRASGIPVRTSDNPLEASTWSKWGYMFVR